MFSLTYQGNIFRGLFINLFQIGNNRSTVRRNCSTINSIPMVFPVHSRPVICRNIIDSHSPPSPPYRPQTHTHPYYSTCSIHRFDLSCSNYFGVFFIGKNSRINLSCLNKRKASLRLDNSFYSFFLFHILALSYIYTIGSLSLY